MNPITRYFAEEIALEHADGLVSRRDALRRLALLGLGATSAVSLLAACSTRASTAAIPTTPLEVSDAGAGTAIATTEITFVGTLGRSLAGAYAEAVSPKGAVLVIHEN